MKVCDGLPRPSRGCVQPDASAVYRPSIETTHCTRQGGECTERCKDSGQLNAQFWFHLWRHVFVDRQQWAAWKTGRDQKSVLVVREVVDDDWDWEIRVFAHKSGRFALAEAEESAQVQLHVHAPRDALCVDFSLPPTLSQLPEVHPKLGTKADREETDDGGKDAVNKC